MCFLLQKKVRKDTQPENVITTSDDNAGIETTDRNWCALEKHANDMWSSLSHADHWFIEVPVHT
jgi:hypothetical protein